jgi:hypothetical protein
MSLKDMIRVLKQAPEDQFGQDAWFISDGEYVPPDSPLEIDTARYTVLRDDATKYKVMSSQEILSRYVYFDTIMTEKDIKNTRKLPSRIFDGIGTVTDMDKEKALTSSKEGSKITQPRVTNTIREDANKHVMMEQDNNVKHDEFQVIRPIIMKAYNTTRSTRVSIEVPFDIMKVKQLSDMLEFDHDDVVSFIAEYINTHDLISMIKMGLMEVMLGDHEHLDHTGDTVKHVDHDTIKELQRVIDKQMDIIDKLNHEVIEFNSKSNIKPIMNDSRHNNLDTGSIMIEVDNTNTHTYHDSDIFKKLSDVDMLLSRFDKNKHS